MQSISSILILLFSLLSQEWKIDEKLEQKVGTITERKRENREKDEEKIQG